MARMRAADQHASFHADLHRLRRHCQWAVLLLAACTILQTARAADPEITDQYRLTLELNARITTNFAGSGTLGFFANPDQENQTYRVEWPNITYLTTDWLHLSGGLLTQFTDNHDSPNQLELRPFLGAKFFVPNKAKLSIFNYTRFEYRNIENLTTHDWEHTSRLRSLFEVDVPLSSRERAWKPNTWLALASAEPFYEFNTHDISELRLGAGVGYVLSDRLRIEFTYYADFTRPNNGALAYTENIFLLNFRFALHKGLLGALLSPFADTGREGAK
jgi:hypothetical protein